MKMASFLPLQVLSLTKSNCCDFIAKDEWSAIHPMSVHCIITYKGNVGVCNQRKKTVLEFRDALSLIWSALREKAIDNAI